MKKTIEILLTSDVLFSRFYTQWWDTEVWACLPRAYEEEAKDRDVMVAIECSNTDENIDSYRYHGGSCVA